ncbi:MAG: ATP-binding cassette domain-containing protein [Lachnospiraceae bacterium]|nr:ATP-binding cassette domain-containing protein [Lachnospiraceae bacterium]
MISIKHIQKKFGEKDVFKDLSMEIPNNSFVVITGESGCGKTTLLNMLGYLEKPDAGDIVVDGKSLKDIKQREFFRNYVGFLFQNFALVENKTVRANLNIIKKVNRTDLTMEEALAKVGLEDKADTAVYKLSGGEQQRVALARVMLKQCRYILADEPTGSLDEKNANIVMSHLHALKEAGKTVIMVTHNREYLKDADMVVEL